MYDVDFSNKAKKQFDKLEKSLKIRIVASLERCRVRPYAHVKKLAGILLFALRVGEYRIILDINNGKMLILVIKLGHRKEIYKK